MAKFERYVANLPKIFKPSVNPVVRSLLKAWAQEDDEVVTQLKNTNSQIFVKTASGQYLDRLASGLSVSRPVELGLLDATFSNVIPNLSYKAKQIRKTMLDLLDATWGPLLSHANVTSNNLEPFNVSTGDEIQVQIDNLVAQTVKVQPGDIAVNGSATAEEIAGVLGRITGATISLVADPVSGTNFVNIRSNTVGLQGSVEVLGGSMIGVSKLDFTLRKFLLTDLSQRTAVYELNNREIVIELPAIFPILRSSLKGSHHFHTDETVEPAVPPDNGIWQGSFFYSTVGPKFKITGKRAGILQQINPGQVYTTLTVDDASEIPNAPGYLIFDFGNGHQEEPVPYIGRPNDSTLLLDPSYVFETLHLVGAKVNYLSELEIFKPRTFGEDLPIYLTSPSGTRNAIQALLLKLVAAGVVVRFEILLPDYYHEVDPNPYE